MVLPMQTGSQEFFRGVQMLTVEQAAERLGLRVSTVRAWVLRRKISYAKIGRAVRIPEKEIERIIQENTIPAKRS